jgi:hypothetical protein
MKYSYAELNEKEFKFLKELCKGFNHKSGLRTAEWKSWAYYARDNAGNKLVFVKDIPRDCIFMISIEPMQDIEDGKIVMQFDNSVLYEMGLRGN